MKKIDVVGRSREDIERVTASMKRSQLLDLVYQLATYEPKLSPASIAAANMIPKARVIQAIKSGSIPRAHKISENNWRVPLSSLREWDGQTLIDRTAA